MVQTCLILWTILATLQPFCALAASFPLRPNDEHLESLWNLMASDEDNPGATNAARAWAEFGTGGKDLRGREIVVAVVDSGFDLAHMIWPATFHQHPRNSRQRSR